MIFNPKAFFSQTKKSFLTFILLAIFFYAVLAVATHDVFIRKCASCPPDWTITIIFFLFSLGALYFLYCWIRHVWQKAIKIS
jgi:hypothetical protein